MDNESVKKERHKKKKQNKTNELKTGKKCVIIDCYYSITI